ncbi:MAG: TolC family protein [Myxococcaceae bacterium]
MMKLIFLIVLWPSLGMAEIQNKLTLSDAIEHALKQSPTIDTVNKNQAISGLAYKNAIYKLLPSLDLNAVNALTNNIPITGTTALLTPNTSAPWFGSLSLQITEDLYDNGASLVHLSIADKKRDLAGLERSKARAKIALDITVEFYHFSRLSALVEVKQRQLEILEKQFNSLSSHYQEGLKPRLDYLRFKTQVQRAQIEKTTVIKSKELSEIALSKLIVDEAQFEPIVITKNKPILPEEPIKLENFYDYKISLIQKKVNEQDVSFIKRKYWPQAFLTAGAGYSNFDYLNGSSPFSPGNQLSYSLTLNIKYNVWDWGIRRRDIEIAECEQNIKNNDLNLNLLEVRSQIDGVMVNISKLKANYDLTEELLTNEEQNFRNIEIEYREGKLKYLDLTTGLSNLLAAREQFYGVYFEALKVLSQYRYYEGTLYE